MENSFHSVQHVHNACRLFYCSKYSVRRVVCACKVVDGARCRCRCRCRLCVFVPRAWTELRGHRGHCHSPIHSLLGLPAYTHRHSSLLVSISFRTALIASYSSPSSLHPTLHLSHPCWDQNVISTKTPRWRRQQRTAAQGDASPDLRQTSRPAPPPRASVYFPHSPPPNTYLGSTRQPTLALCRITTPLLSTRRHS